MAGPWEKYAQPAQDGPWAKYAAAPVEAQDEPRDEPVARTQSIPAKRPTGLLGLFAGPAPIRGETLEEQQADYRGRPAALRALVGVGQMVDSNVRGANQLAGTVNPAMDANSRATNELISGDGATFAGRVGAEGLALLAPGGAISKLASLPARMAAGSALGAGYGALQAEDAPGQRLTNTLVGGIFGSGGELLASGLRAGAGQAARAIDPVRQNAIRFAQERGIPLHLSQLSQSLPVKAMASMAQYLPFSGAGKAAAKQQRAFNQAVGETFGARGAEQLTDDVMLGARRNLSGQFEDIYSRNNVPVGEGGLRKLVDVERGAASRLTEAESAVVRKQMDSILAELDDAGALTGQKYQALRSQIMKAEGPDKMGQAVRELRGALDDIAAKAVGPEDAAKLKALRSQWANLRTTEGALKQVAGAGGDVKPSSIWPAIRKGSTKEMRELGRLGQIILKNSVPDSGTPGRLISLGLLGGGGLTGGIGTIPSLAALVAGGATAGRALNSPAAANLLLSSQRAAPATLNSLARIAAPGSLAVSPAAAAVVVPKERRRLKDR